MIGWDALDQCPALHPRSLCGFHPLACALSLLCSAWHKPLHTDVFATVLLMDRCAFSNKKGPVPRSSLSPTTGQDALYSGLLECPLTTRITKDIEANYDVLATGTWLCTPVHHQSKCGSRATGYWRGVTSPLPFPRITRGTGHGRQRSRWLCLSRALFLFSLPRPPAPSTPRSILR